MDCPLSDMVIDDGYWNLDFFRLWVSKGIISKIVGISSPHPTSGHDRIIWGGISWNTNAIIKVSYSWVKQYAFVSKLLSFKTQRLTASPPLSNTELWGILDGFKLILDLGFERVLIQIDSLEAVNAIQDGSFGNSNFTLVRRIHQLLAIVEHWRPQHIPREENKITDGLIKMIRDTRT
ncbi:hypothetical protein Golax_010944 [Gossypium laxum]|uniref:RNase H type-1 domain-containing protein n=1 Tax=Gossypium laxum TaxID=34288 RepID=A0A7J8ZIX5_9ROSI|nr:hypothetical protein [Gossypium laxum]